MPGLGFPSRAMGPGARGTAHLQWTEMGPSWPNCSLVLCTWPMKSMKPSPDFGTPCSGQSVNWNCRTVRDWPSCNGGEEVPSGRAGQQRPRLGSCPPPASDPVSPHQPTPPAAFPVLGSLACHLPGGLVCQHLLVPCLTELFPQPLIQQCRQPPPHPPASPSSVPILQATAPRSTSPSPPTTARALQHHHSPPPRSAPSSWEPSPPPHSSVYPERHQPSVLHHPGRHLPMATPPCAPPTLRPLTKWPRSPQFILVTLHPSLSKGAIFHWCSPFSAGYVFRGTASPARGGATQPRAWGSHLPVLLRHRRH